jgi:hypothetical protein
LYGLDDEWILGPLGVLGDQLVVQSFVTVMLQAVPAARRVQMISQAWELLYHCPFKIRRRHETLYERR